MNTRVPKAESGDDDKIALKLKTFYDDNKIGNKHKKIDQASEDEVLLFWVPRYI